MAGEESSGGAPETLTEEQAERMLTEINEVIRAGEEMRALRAEMIQVFAGLGWTQDTIARLAGMSQPAVSKQMTKHRDAPPAPPALTLDQSDAPWLEGRLWGLAEEISELLDGTAHCTRHLDALGRGRKRFTPQTVDALRRLVEADLRVSAAELPTGFRAAYDTVSRGLDVPARDTPPSASASVRRALARQLQRDRLRGD
ncbi:hypothetical protein [Streptomyces sp. DSM 15324]|uniref:hypothetical protein n=1 Tax=Streptomyces sp. DSM 15324 TaxID=1739111 RepID=UPI000748C5B8|nr:hypothetical protein [Streptomyces sp. DSM 15324]KUO06841.1 hypothetical protein AQJ58_38385 [Streptomyces sp. DSM 15324]